MITYDINGAREGLLDGISGFYYPAFDRGKLGESLARLLDDSALRTRWRGRPGVCPGEVRRSRDGVSIEAVYHGAAGRREDYRGGGIMTVAWMGKSGPTAASESP